MANTERAKQLFLDMARINSPSGRERPMVDFLMPILADMGFEVAEDDSAPEFGGEAGNLIAWRSGSVPSAKSIFFCCHLDTVEPTEGINIVEDGDTIRTDGKSILGADDKAGIAAVIEGLRMLMESGAAHGDIQVLFDVSEENGLHGAKALDRSKIRAEMGFVLDTERPAASITWSAPSHESVHVEITGAAAHAGLAPEKGVSAIVAASRAIAKMNLGRIDDETTANVGVIEGGKARNIIPDHAVVHAEARSRSEEKLVDQVDHMRTVFESEAEAIGAKAVVRSEREYTGFRLTENDPVVRLAASAARRVGVEVNYREGGGGSDANVFNAAGVPCVLIGMACEGAHSASESLRVPDLVLSADFVLALCLEAAEV